MKGTIKLAPIEHPVEGMKVIRNGMVETISSCSTTNDLIGIVGSYWGWDNLSELQQLVVIYTTFHPAGTCTGICGDFHHTQSILLHPDDWEKGLELLGKEVEINIPFVHNEYATLVNSSSILYTEEEVRILAFDAMIFGIEKVREDGDWDTEYNDWWNQNKKK